MAKLNAVVKAHADGVAQGRREMRTEVLTFLEEKYMDPKVERKSDRGEAILTLAKELSEWMK